MLSWEVQLASSDTKDETLCPKPKPMPKTAGTVGVLPGLSYITVQVLIMPVYRLDFSQFFV
jgi:hypothetical protein